MYNTNKKKKILEIFENNKDNTFTGPRLVEMLSDTMNKTTIYRQLKSLEEANYVMKLYNPENDTYEYQYANKCSEHFHLKCKNCGKVIHLTCSEADYFINHILEHHKFQIDKYSTTIYGICSECK